MLVSTRIRTRVLPERKKSEYFLSKALPLSHGGIRLDGDKSRKEFPISKMLLVNIGHELTYNYNRCQNAIFFKLIMESRKRLMCLGICM